MTCHRYTISRRSTSPTVVLVATSVGSTSARQCRPVYVHPPCVPSQGNFVLLLFREGAIFILIWQVWVRVLDSVYHNRFPNPNHNPNPSRGTNPNLNLNPNPNP